ncbi:MAG: hypothetical protein ACLUT1_03860 [Ruminococcus sp.]
MSRRGTRLRAGIPHTTAVSDCDHRHLRLGGTPCHCELCAKHQVTGIEGFGYGKGWEYEAEEIGRFLDRTERLIQAGINVAPLATPSPGKHPFQK